MGEICHLDFIKSLFVPKIPEWSCIEKPASLSVTVSEPFAVSIEAVIGMFFVLIAGMLGILIVELLYNKSDYFLDPLVRLTVKRYCRVQERERLKTMNGHP